MNKLIWLMVIVVTLFPAGCSSLAAPTATVEASATEAIPTQVKVTPSLTNTYTPEPTMTPTPLPPTWTPQPTLNSEEAQKLLSKLLEDNGGCKLPCFWGITPGKTNWQEAISFLETFTMVGIRNVSESIQILEPLIPFPKRMGTIWHSY